MTVGELQERMSVDEYLKWAAFYKNEAREAERAAKRRKKG